MSDDIESLKRLKIEPRRDRVHLPQIGAPQADPIDEAYGGTGRRPDGPIDKEALRTAIVDALKLVFDPEIPVNVYDLGLIYGFEIDDDANVAIEMTLTAPACPVAGMLVNEVAKRVGDVPGVNTSRVKLTWDPPWTKDRMSEDALLELGLL
jgi:FeS assembly SUF system protein